MESISQTLGLADEHYEAGNLNEAEAHYQAMLRAEPTQSEAMYGLGGIALRRRQYLQAIVWFRQAVALPSATAAMYNNLGAAYRASGQRAEAEASFRQALRVEPNHAEAYCNLGDLLREQGKLQEAIARYQLAALARPTFVDAHLRLGVALREAGDSPQAIDQLQQAARIRPDHPELHRLLGIMVREQGQGQRALHHFRQALRLKPDDLGHRFRLANILQEQGQWEESEPLLREVVRLQSRFAEGQHLLGRALLKRDRPGEAIVYLQEAVRLKPGLPGLHADLGEAYQRMGDLDASLAYFLADRPEPRAARKPPAATSENPPSQPALAQPGSAEQAGSPASSSPPGVLLREQGRLDEALAVLEQAVTQEPESARLRYELARTWKAKNDGDKAIVEYREAVRLDPDFAEAYLALGMAVGDQGRMTEAVTAFQHALRIKPDCLEAYLNLGKAYREQGDRDRSVAYLQHALHLCPNLFDAYHKLALTLADQGKLEEAVAAYREVLRLKPDFVPGISQLGGLLLQLGQADEGHRLSRQALELVPHDAENHCQYGRSLVSLGRLEEGKTHFLEALACRPEHAEAYFLLARDHNYQFTDAELNRIRDLLVRQEIPLLDRINLHFALARAFDRAKSFDEAFYHCDQANACRRELFRRQGNAFRPEVQTRFVDRSIATFDKAYFERVRSFGSDSDLPIFIVGMPRSGSTLVEQILASHPAVFGAGETANLSRLIEDLPAELASAAPVPECLVSMDEVSARRLADGYIERLKRVGGDKQRVTDKMLANVQHLGLIATLVPRAQIIHCRRDPLDVCWSCHFQNFHDVNFACDFQALAIYYREYQRLMAHWQAVLPMPIYEVSYEQLVDDAERISRELIAFCRLPWDDACLRFNEAKRLIRTASDIQVRQPILRKAVGYWKNYERHLGPLLKAFGESVT
jgi:tetratricopeptide (TPR) repeat protein